MADVVVRACSVVDPICEWPLAIGATGTNGSAALLVDSIANKPPLSLFLDMRKDGYLHTLVLLSTPPVGSNIDAVGFLIRSEDAAALSAPTVNDPTRSTVVVRVLDCHASVPSSSAGAVNLSWLDTDRQTVLEHTAAGADFDALNVPINAAHITRVVARLTATQQLIAAASAPVRLNAVTWATLLPTP
jgi:hypothetical protein